MITQLVIGSVAGTIALAGLVFMLIVTRRFLFVKRARPSKISEVKPGKASVEGKIIPLKLLESPISRTQCTNYVLELQQHNGKYGWMPETSDIRGTEFILEDETGQIMVDSTNADIDDYHKIKVVTVDESHYGILDEMGVNPKGMLGFKKKQRIVEKVICPREQVTVMGRARRRKSTGKIEIQSFKDGKGPLLYRDVYEKLLMNASLWLYGVLSITSVSLVVMILCIVWVVLS